VPAARSASPPPDRRAWIALLESADGRTGGGVLYRALRGDVAPRFVHITREAPPPGAAAYDVVHEDGDPDGAGGAVLIAPFDGDDELVARWEALREQLAGRQGYLGSRLHRSAGAAEFRFVALVRWSSPLMYARTLRQPATEQALAALPHEPALYLAE
jgi:hypothetical protein